MGLGNCFGTKHLGAFGVIVRGNLSLVGYLFVLSKLLQALMSRTLSSQWSRTSTATQQSSSMEVTNFKI